MSRFAWSTSLMVMALALTACTRITPYRIQTIGGEAGRPMPIVAECDSGEGARATGRTPAGERKPCEAKDGAAGEHALQHRHYIYTDHGRPGAPKAEGDYHLAFVEFDDQGWFADRRQMQALFLLLDQLETRQKREVLLFVYVHGWKHNASRCDGNVLCFSRVLERVDILERHHPLAATGRAPRAVVGVYVGWRGLSLDAGLLTNVTFWTRKAAAERVGRGGVHELLTRLNDYRRNRNPNRLEEKTQLILTGHSFGGLVMYSALNHALTANGMSVERYPKVDSCHQPPVGHRQQSPPTEGRTCYTTASSVGDLVVLVNPAFEGSLYETVSDVASNRCYPPWQRPVLMTVTSAADNATGIAFPLGRRVSTLFERAAAGPVQRDSITAAIGHDPRYQTHELNWVGSSPPPASPGATGSSCECTGLEPTETFDFRTFVANLHLVPPPSDPHASGSPLAAAATDKDRRIYDAYGPNVRLTGDTKYRANYPYLVVKTDGNVIKDHNSIYSEPFIRFLHSFFLHHIATRRPFEADPCPADPPMCKPGGSLPCQ